MPKIIHKMVGEYHVFTSPDIPGLNVADKNREVAESRIQPTIEALQRMQERRQNEERIRSRRSPVAA